MRTLTIPISLLLALALPGQEKEKKESDAEKLDRLLRELRQIDGNQWQAKLKQLQGQAQQHRQRATQMRKEAQELEAAAKTEEHQAKKVEAELQRLQELMRVLAVQSKQTIPKPAPKPAPKAAPKAARKEAEPAPDLVTYDDHVQAIFEANCTGCHDPDEHKGGLDLTTYGTALRGGGSGKTIVPGNADGSRLYMLVSHQEKPTMPPDEGPIQKAQIDLIRRWIAAGAPENKKAAAARKRLAAGKARSRPKPGKVLVEGPVPMPKNWPALAAAKAERAVTAKTLATSPRGPLWAVPGREQVLVLDAQSRKLSGVLPFADGEVEVLRFSADGSRLLAAGGRHGSRGTAMVYDVVTGKTLAHIRAGGDAVLAAAISPDNQRVALGGSNKRVCVHDAGSGDRLFEVSEHNDFVLGTDFSSDGKYLVSCDRKGQVVVTDARDGRNVHVLRGHRDAVHAVACNASGDLAASVGEDGTVRAWHLPTGRQRWSRRASSGAVLAVAWSPQGLLATAGAEGRTRLWNADGQPRGNLPPNAEWIYAVGFDAKSQLLFTGDWQGRARVFDVRRRRQLQELVPTKAPK